MAKVAFIRPDVRSHFIEQIAMDGKDLKVRHGEIIEEVDNLSRLFEELTRADHETAMSMGLAYLGSEERNRAKVAVQVNLNQREALLLEAKALRDAMKEKWAWLEETFN